MTTAVALEHLVNEPSSHDGSKEGGRADRLTQTGD